MEYYKKILDKYTNEKYRYRLIVKFKEEPEVDRTLVVIQLNPSYASLDRSDPIAGKVESWAKSNNFEKILFLNLFAIIDPYFCNICEYPIDILIGPQNNNILKKAFDKYNKIVAAWGSSGFDNNSKTTIQRIIQIKHMLDNKKIYNVGDLSYGVHPKHGLAWNKNPKLKQFDFDKYIKTQCSQTQS